MSRIAKYPIMIPNNVEVKFQENDLLFSGPLGTDEKITIPRGMTIKKESSQLFINSNNIALVGTYNSLLRNIIIGITTGYEKILEVKGVGYKVIAKDNKLVFELGRSHQIEVVIPHDLSILVQNNKITIKGIDKQKVTS